MSESRRTSPGERGESMKMYVYEMPKNCLECPCFNRTQGYKCGLIHGDKPIKAMRDLDWKEYLGGNLWLTIDYREERYSKCPLILIETHDCIEKEEAKA